MSQYSPNTDRIQAAYTPTVTLNPTPNPCYHPSHTDKKKAPVVLDTDAGPVYFCHDHAPVVREVAA